MTIFADSHRLAREATAIRAAYADLVAESGVGAPLDICLAYTADGWLVTHTAADVWHYAGFELDGTVFLEAFDTSADYERIASESDYEQRLRRRFAALR